MNGTKEYGVLYSTSDNFKLIGYTDSDWARSVDDINCTSRYVFHLGLGAISWASKKQPIVSLSTTEDEYVVATTTSCQVV